MDKFLGRWRPSPSMIVAMIALFVALGGSVYAAHGHKIIGSKVKKNTLPGNRVKKNSLPGNRVKKNSIGGTQIDEATLGTVPRANTAGSATSAATSLSPVAWAHVNSSGGLVDGQGIAQSNIVEPYGDGEYCFKNLGFQFRSLQVTVDAKDTGVNRDITAQASVGDPADCGVAPGGVGAGTQAGVVTGGSGLLPKAGFFIWFFD